MEEFTRQKDKELGKARCIESSTEPQQNQPQQNNI